MKAAARVVAVASLLAPSAALAADKPLVLWHAYRGDEEKALEALVADSGLSVELLALPYDAFGSKLAAAVPVGRGPDVYIDAHERLGDYVGRGIVGEPGDAFESPEAYPRSVREAVTFGGAARAVPIGQKSLALYRNLALAPRAPATFEEATEHRVPEGAFPLAFELGAYGFAPLLHAFGGRLLAEDEQYGFVGPEAEASLRYAQALLAKRVMPEDADGALVKELFRAGKAAFVLSGPWFAAELGGSPVRWAVSPLPMLAATKRPLSPFLTVESLFLSPQGAARPDARALVRHLSSKHAAALRAKLSHTVPARIDVPMDSDPVLEAFRAQADRSTPMPTSAAMRSTWEPANRAIRKVLRGEAPPEVALPEGKRRFDDVRRPLPPARSPTPLVVALGVGLLVLVVQWLRTARARQHELRRSLPAYAWVAHAALAVGALVVFPLAIGALTSLFAGRAEDLRYVGLANFWNILTARGGPLLGSGSFYLVLLVTLVWTAVNLLLHVGLGTAIGLLLHRPALRLRAVYRVLLIIPWAVPSYVTALSWKGMFHKQFGAVTALTRAVAHGLGLDLQPIAWFSSFGTAFTANVLTNAWLGFPFMMVATLGALTSIPTDVLEAAEVDGATRWQRLRHVVLPMLAPSMAPAVTLGAVWTFNQFNVVFLVSGGDPDGTTDILVSEAYRWAFTREAQYGYAAAYAVLIFLLLAGFSRLGRRPGDAQAKATKEVWA